MEKQVAIKLQDYLVVWHGRDNHPKQMIHKVTVTNLTTKHKNFNFYETKMNQKDIKTPCL